MIRHTILAPAVFALAMAVATPCFAAGCMEGAAVGGIAGHMAGHGVLGAGAGCAVGHHEAKKKAEESRQNQTVGQANPKSPEEGR